MNIGIVTTWFERGAAYVSRNYMQLLQSTGHNVFIFARGGEGTESKNSPEWNDINVTRYERYINTTISKHAFFRWIELNRIEAILFNEQRDYRIVAETKRRYPTIKLGAYVDYYTESSREWFNLYDFVICNTQRHMQALEGHSHKYYVKWGVDINLYRPEIKQSKEVIFFHSVGMSNRKGTDILVEAFIQEECYLKSKLIIHTQIPINRVCRYSANQLAKYNIEVIEKTVSAPGLYKLGDVYVYPTRLDGLGLTMYEALACGLPVITSDFAPMNEAVNERIGKLVEIEDYYCRDDAYYYPMVSCNTQALGRAMKWYINHIDELKIQKKYAREYAVSHYNLEDRAEMISDIFINAEVQPLDLLLYKKYLKDFRQRFSIYQWFFSHRIVGKIINKLKQRYNNKIN